MRIGLVTEAGAAVRAEWTDPSNRYTFAVYGDNVTGKEYRTMAKANATGIGAGWGAPATAGVSIRARFQFDLV